jgi:hypothetical protein
MREAGYDTNVYELNCALDAALSQPAARKCFESKQAPFKKLSGDDVPGEFEEFGD